MDLFQELEKPVLRPLPPTAFEIVSRKKAKVGLDYQIKLARAYYSVPHRFVGKEIEVRFTNKMVEILYESDRIAVHPRLARTGARHTESEHMPSHHRAQTEWTPERFLRWAKEAGGEHTCTLASQIMARYPHPEQGFRSCRALIRLTETYGKQRVDEACRVVLSRGEPKCSRRRAHAKDATESPASVICCWSTRKHSRRRILPLRRTERGPSKSNRRKTERRQTCMEFSLQNLIAEDELLVLVSGKVKIAKDSPRG